MRSALQRGKPILCYITDRHTISEGSVGESSEGFGDLIEAVARSGVDWIQIREKDMTGRALSLLVRDAERRMAKLKTKGARPRILVNDRLDVAVAEGAGGVHLAESSLPVAEALRLLATERPGVKPLEDFLVGISTHSRTAARAAAEAGADYVIFGPVFPTPSKAVFGQPQGLEKLREVCVAVKIPVLAIGGIRLENAASCVQAGAAGVAAIRLFQNAANPEDVVRRLRGQLR